MDVCATSPWATANPTHPPGQLCHFFGLAWCHMVQNVPLVTVWVGCPGCVPFQLPVHPQLTHRQGSMRNQKSLVLFKCCSVTTKTFVCYQHFSHLQNTAPYQLIWGKLNSVPAETRTLSQLMHLCYCLIQVNLDAVFQCMFHVFYSFFFPI